MRIVNSISNPIPGRDAWRLGPVSAILSIALAVSWVLRLCRSSIVGYFLYGVVTRGLNYGLATLAMIAMRQFSDLFHQEKFIDTL
jgi:hypothetical protein